jgi:hypothetical protein
VLISGIEADVGYDIESLDRLKYSQGRPSHIENLGSGRLGAEIEAAG